MPEATRRPRAEDNVGHVLWHRAALSPDRPAYTFLRNGIDDAHAVSYGELQGLAGSLAAHLGEFPRGARAMLLYPHGLEFVRAFWACLIAGILPVPCYPPRNPRATDRLLSIAADAQVSVILSDRALLGRFGRQLTEVAPCLPTDQLAGSVDRHDPGAGQVAAVHLDDPAFLQYTSGSTGAPKGVVVSHRNLYRNQELIRAAFGQDSGSTIVSWLPFYHDMGLIGNLLHAVHVGAHAVFLSPVEFLRRPMSWLEAISAYRATGSGAPTFGYQHCCDRIDDRQIARLDLSRWQVAYCGAELVRAPTLDAFAGRFGAAGFRAEAFRPCYGMAEATLLVAAANGSVTRAPDAVEAGAAPAALASSGEPVVSCGIPHGFECLVVDEHGAECPEGGVGELWLSGESVASGYWNDPEASAAFHAVTSSGRGPFYRTGDLGFLRGGELHVTGRIKELLVIRGRNHYPYDLEWSIADGAPGVVRDGCVVFSVDRGNGEELVVQCEYERTCGLPHDEVIRSVRTVLLEEFGVTAAEVFLVAPRRLPRTSSGKLQRALCRTMFLAGRSGGIAHWAARGGEPASAAVEAFPAISAAERLIARAIEQVRGPIRIGRGDTFFGVGFDSLAMAELSAVVSTVSGRAVGVEVLFEYATIPELAAHLDTLPATDVASVGSVGSEAPGGPADGLLPLSSIQESIWADHQSRVPDSRYNVSVRVGFPAEVPRERVEAVVANELGRAELLRCRVVRQDGRLGLRSAGEQHRVDVLDLSRTDTDRAGAELDACAKALARQPFDLDEYPLFRTVLASLPDGSHTLVLVAHHLVCDGFSLHTLARRLLALGNGVELPAARPDTSYRTYVRRQRELVARDGLEAGTYWRTQLADVVPLRLPRDRRPVRGGDRGSIASRWQHLTAEQSTSLAALARRCGTTPFAVALTAFATVVGKITRRSDVVVGVPLLDRDLPAMTDTFGPCINPVVLRCRLAGDQSGADRVAAIGDDLTAALGRRALPVREVAGELGADQHDARVPLTSVCFNGLTFAAHARVAEAFPGDLGTVARLDLDVYAILDSDGRGSLRWDYDASLSEPSTLAVWMAGFEACLRRLTRDPDATLDAEPLLVPRPVSSPAVEPADSRRPLLDAVADTMTRFAERVAVVTPLATTTYGQLLESSRGVRDHVSRTSPSGPVGLHFRAGETASAISAMIGTLSAGRSYVVLEPRDPVSRRQRIIADGGVRLVIADGDVAFAGDEQPEVMPITRILGGRIDAAGISGHEAGGLRTGYLLYTSGTSGTPKGVIQEVENVGYFVDQYRRRLSITEHDTLSLVSSLGFDAAVLDVYTALVTGARLQVLALHEDSAHRDLWRWVTDQGVTVLHATPSLYRRIMSTRTGSGTGRLRAVVLGGEPVLPADAIRHHELFRGVDLYNLYGQAESTLNSLRRIDAGSSAHIVTLGEPCAGTTLSVRVDHGGRPEVYEVGEVVVGSTHVAKGYLGLPELSAERFTDAGYLTGDSGRLRPDGEIELVGRTDRQVKVNGYRVEPAEIETVLMGHPAVSRARVIKHDGGGGESLTAYVEVLDGRRRAALDVADLRRLVAATLPGHMVPATTRVLDAFPLTHNNKLDTSRLPPPGEPLRQDLGPSRPMNEQERVVAECVEGVLGVAAVGPESSFFELGGSSISAIELLHRLERTTGVTVSFRDVFESPTVAAIAARLGSAHAAAWPALSRGPARAEYPATSAQTRIWMQDQRTSYNVLASIHLADGLEPRRLGHAIDAVVARHESLRTRFAVRDDEVVQLVVGTPPASEVLVEHVDAAADQEPALAALERRELRGRFDLAAGPLFRVTYVAGARPHDVLMLSMHHIVCDAISVAIFVEEVLAAYALRLESLPTPAIQHGDYALWLRDLDERGLLTPSRAYWEAKLKDGVPALALRTDRPRGAVRSFAGSVFHGVVDEALTARARDLCLAEGVTLFTLLHAVTVLTLYNRTGQTDLCIGTLSTGRELSRHLQPQIGFLASTLALRTRVTTGMTFRELMTTARREFLESNAHQLYPVERLADVVPRPDPGRGFLFDVLLVLHDWGELEERVRRRTGVEITLRDRHESVSKFDLTFNFASHGGRVEAMVEFDSDLYDQGSVALLWRRFTALLEEAVDAPERSLAAFSGAVEEERIAAAHHEIDFDF